MSQCLVGCTGNNDGGVSSKKYGEVKEKFIEPTKGLPRVCGSPRIL